MKTWTRFQVQMSQLDSLKLTQKPGLYEQKAEILHRFQNSDVRAENRKLKSFPRFQNSDVTVAEKRIRSRV